MEVAGTVHAKQETRCVVYAEGTVIRMGEGRVGIYIDADYKDDVMPLLGQRVRLLILGAARPRGRRSS